ncbi:MAG: dienelactone hydrolase family protein [Chthoniobacterales bacterium]
MNCKHVLAIFLSGLLTIASARAQPNESSVVQSGVELRIGGDKIPADVFERADHPAGATILVLHGAGGILFDGPEMRRVGRSLAADGNAVYLIHYFAKTGTLFALDSTMQKNFDTWLKTVRGAVVAVQELRGDASPVGIYGYSLGGFLSLLAASDNPRVGAVVEHAGGIWNNKMERVGKMPPVLMIHGLEDARVPVEKYAKPLIPVLRQHAPTVATRFFPGEGHGFASAAMVKVREEARRFFRAHLARETKSPAPKSGSRGKIGRARGTARRRAAGPA